MTKRRPSRGRAADIKPIDDPPDEPPTNLNAAG
jgi:hypothetical protein